MHFYKALYRITSVAAVVLLVATGSSCARRVPSVQPNTPAVQQEDSGTVRPEDEKIAEILKEQNLLDTMNSWQGQMLLVRTETGSDPHALRYYAFNSTYQDSNQNGVQDPDDFGFFNPASTVKVAIAALVLESLSQQHFTRQAEYRIVGTSRWHSFEEDIRRALIISDNEAANRLILWLGFDEINQRLANKGLSFIVINRLMLDKGTLIPSTAFEMRFEDKITQQPEKPVTIQASCYETDRKVGNCASADDLLQSLMRLNQPDYFNADEGFTLSPSDRDWLRTIMSRTPQEEGFDYVDDYCRFLTEVENRLASNGGKMLSKCGVSLFTNTYSDLSYLETDAGQAYYILLSVTPPPRTEEARIVEQMNQIAEALILSIQ